MTNQNQASVSSPLGEDGTDSVSLREYLLAFVSSLVMAVIGTASVVLYLA